jgi:hypothetical protein
MSAVSAAAKGNPDAKTKISDVNALQVVNG